MNEQFPMFTGDTLAAARQRFFDEAQRNGYVCPCCERFGKFYRRKLNSQMARTLIRMYRLSMGAKAPPLPWLDIDSILTSRAAQADYGKLRYWKLVENKPNEENPEQKDSGLWRITLAGIVFARGNIALPKYKIIYNDEVRGESEEKVTIYEALGEKFNYADLMAGI